MSATLETLNALLDVNDDEPWHIVIINHAGEGATGHVALCGAVTRRRPVSLSEVPIEDLCPACRALDT